MEGWRISLLEKERTIFVDADACPVKDEVLKTAADFDVKVVFVASFEHFSRRTKIEKKRTLHERPEKTGQGRPRAICQRAAKNLVEN